MNSANRQWVTVLGSTGSIGTNTLDVLQRNSERYGVYALSANRNVDLLFQQCQQYKPARAVMADGSAADELSLRLRRSGLENIAVASGDEALQQLASAAEVHIVMLAVVGYAGLAPCMAAAVTGKRILLANKEAMVVGGQLLTQAARRGGALIMPVDSEHNAIFQSLPAGDLTNWAEKVEKIILTASGGPFRTWTLEQMCDVTVSQALAHPNWEMGRKISIDSATMMNKGLEIIEASHLFGLGEADIEVVVHPQSVIHSMVRYRDGSVLAQLGRADMRTPIAHALAWPERIDAGVEALDFSCLGNLQFESPDHQRFPCLALAREALRAGGAGPAALNAANEVAVEAFLQKRIGFCDIARINHAALSQCQLEMPATLDDLAKIDQEIRRFSLDIIENGFEIMELS